MTGRDDLDEAFAEVVWLLGAGFSKPLGGPLFTSFFSPTVAAWVSAWGRKYRAPKIVPEEIVETYKRGQKLGRWSDAEEFMALVEQAAEPSGDMARHFWQGASAMQVVGQQGFESYRNRVSTYAAVATSHFVPNADEKYLSESWQPYERWIETLNEHDSVITFNYDRVVETLQERAKRSVRLIKLHGGVPLHDELVRAVAENRGVPSILVPGHRKLIASHEEAKSEWEQAAAALRVADHLVIVGYSFPPSDSLAAAFVLKNSAAGVVSIVLGLDDAAARVQGMFRRTLDIPAINSGLLAQQYLTEGTVRPLSNGRFRHP
jgi:hypothetical protein